MCYAERVGKCIQLNEDVGKLRELPDQRSIGIWPDGVGTVTPSLAHQGIISTMYKAGGNKHQKLTGLHIVGCFSQYAEPGI